MVRWKRGNLNDVVSFRNQMSAVMLSRSDSADSTVYYVLCRKSQGLWLSKAIDRSDHVCVWFGGKRTSAVPGVPLRPDSSLALTGARGYHRLWLDSGQVAGVQGVCKVCSKQSSRGRGMDEKVKVRQARRTTGVDAAGWQLPIAADHYAYLFGSQQDRDCHGCI